MLISPPSENNFQQAWPWPWSQCQCCTLEFCTWFVLYCIFCCSSLSDSFTHILQSHFTDNFTYILQGYFTDNFTHILQSYLTDIFTRMLQGYLSGNLTHILQGYLTDTGAILWLAALIMPSHLQNTHVFADGRKDMNDIFNNHVCSASHMHPGLHFQNV